MSDLMYLQSITDNTTEKDVVSYIEDGIDLYPQALLARCDYYKKLYDKYHNNKGLSSEFKKNFSLFVSKVSDRKIDLMDFGYEDAL